MTGIFTLVLYPEKGERRRHERHSPFWCRPGRHRRRPDLEPSRRCWNDFRSRSEVARGTGLDAMTARTGAVVS